ncbi:hypothetical protein BC835DRAFT_1423012 [Cytidiella melzeri]|nr:hypothetical protein BC835DRAFT_1423012 [Cytidiella melzeri]
MAFLLFGISIMQLYQYSMTSNRDHLSIRVSVYTVFLLDIFQSIVVAAQGWYALGLGWGRPLALLQLNWTFGTVPAITGIVAAWVQIFYAWRIYKLSQWIFLPGFIVAAALMQCAGALSITVGVGTFVTAVPNTYDSTKYHFTQIPSLSDVTDLHLLYRRTIVWLGGAFAADIIIAVVMVYLLLSVRRSKFAHTQRVINRLIRLTVETGVVTATCAFMELIMFQVLPTTNLHLFFAAMLAKIYYNALMTSLNSRRTEERLTDTNAISSTTSSTFQTKRTGKHNPFSSFTTSGGTTMGDSTVVHISTDQEVDDTYSTDLKTKGVYKEDMHPANAIPMANIRGPQAA